jgi:hypothetical protein
MSYSIGEELTYTSIGGRKETVKIIKRAVDYENGVIDEPNYKGNFDYFVSVERNNGREFIFCKNDELTEL